MPKVVDHDARREELAEAVWRVIRRDGLEHASVRNVAAEAGLSMGSLRHYFATQSGLLSFAMRLVSDRVLERVYALDLQDRDPRRRVEQVLAEILPLDADRRAEAEVWLAFTGRALVDLALRELHDQQYDLLHDGCRRLVRALVDSGEAPPDLDVDVEAERLYALVDGLTMHGIMRPERVPVEQVRAVLARHLDTLCG